MYALGDCAIIMDKKTCSHTLPQPSMQSDEAKIVAENIASDLKKNSRNFAMTMGSLAMIGTAQ